MHPDLFSKRTQQTIRLLEGAAGSIEHQAGLMADNEDVGVYDRHVVRSLRLQAAQIRAAIKRLESELAFVAAVRAAALEAASGR